MRPSPGLVVFILGLLYAIGSCTLPSPTARSESERGPPPAGVSALALVQHPDANKDRRVRVMLILNSYRTNKSGLVWVDGHPQNPPLVFQCDPPTSGTPPLDITGTCRGRVGQVVIVSDCTVRVIPSLSLFSRVASERP